MTLGDVLRRYARQAVVASAITSEVVMTQLPGPAAGIAVGVAAAGGLWAVQGRARQKSAIGIGPSAQALTWQVHAGRKPDPPDDETYRYNATRMWQATEHERRASAG